MKNNMKQVFYGILKEVITLFGLINKKKLAVIMKKLKEANNMQDMKKEKPASAQYYQGFEDGGDNICNYVIDVICK
jgi:hypothetical protein